MKNKFSDKKTSLKYIILLFIITLILFWKVLFNPNYIIWGPYSDFVSQHIYWNYFKYKSVNEFKQFPLWNPYTFSGYPYVGDTFSHLFTPTSLIFYFLDSNW